MKYHTNTVDTVTSLFFIQAFNLLLPSAHKNARIAIISILNLYGTIEKNCNERRDYESVDEKSISKTMSLKTTKKEFRQ